MTKLEREIFRIQHAGIKGKNIFAITQSRLDEIQQSRLDEIQEDSTSMEEKLEELMR